MLDSRVSCVTPSRSNIAITGQFNTEMLATNRWCNTPLLRLKNMPFVSKLCSFSNYNPISAVLIIMGVAYLKLNYGCPYHAALRTPYILLILTLEINMNIITLALPGFAFMTFN